MSDYFESVPIEILLIEDNPGDVGLAEEALRDAKVSNHLTVAKDGETALQVLRQEEGYAETPRPDLILLDLGLPGMSGKDVLREIKADPYLCGIPVVVLTVSEEDIDIVESYDLHANCYLAKPIDAHQFLNVFKMLEGFWLTVVNLPFRR